MQLNPLPSFLLNLGTFSVCGFSSSRPAAVSQGPTALGATSVHASQLQPGKTKEEDKLSDIAYANKGPQNNIGNSNYTTCMVINEK